MCTNYLIEFSVNLDRIWSIVEPSWCDEPHMPISSHLVNLCGKEPNLSDLAKQNFNVGLHSGIYR